DLEGRGDAGELGNLPGAGLPVEPLDVARLAHRQRRAEVDLEEAIGADDGPRPIPVLAERRDDRDEDDGPGVVEEPGDLGGAANILRPVAPREGEVPVQAEAQVVAVEHVDVASL